MKTKVILKCSAIVCALLMLFSLSACGDSDDKSDKNSIVGKWAYSGDAYVYTFNEDGTGTYEISGGTTMKFTYKADEKKLSITYDGNTSPMVLEYSIDGDTLNVKDSFGSDTIYKRK